VHAASVQINPTNTHNKPLPPGDSPRLPASTLILEHLYIFLYESLCTMSGSKVFSIEGKGLKLTTAEDIEPHIQDLKTNDHVEEVKFLGNTLGIEASEALAKVLQTKKNLRVCALPFPRALTRLT
jgi:hypothetical protein